MLLDVPIDNDLLLTYPTPILHRVWPATDRLNAALRRIILERERAHPEFQATEMRRSNQGGWRSEPDLMSWPEPEIAELGQMIQQGLGQVLRLALGPSPGNRRVRADQRVTAWVNVNRQGSYNVVHNHPDSHWSGVYYVSIGEPDPGHPMSGVFEFHDPRPAAGALPLPGFDFGNKFLVRPTPGAMLVFPSWHNHMVHPYFGTGERVSIAFNIRMTNFRIVS